LCVPVHFRSFYFGLEHVLHIMMLWKVNFPVFHFGLIPDLVITVCELIIYTFLIYLVREIWIRSCLCCNFAVTYDL